MADTGSAQVKYGWYFIYIREDHVGCKATHPLSCRSVSDSDNVTVFSKDFIAVECKLAFICRFYTEKFNSKLFT